MHVTFLLGNDVLISHMPYRVLETREVAGTAAMLTVGSVLHDTHGHGWIFLEIYFAKAVNGPVAKVVRG